MVFSAMLERGSHVGSVVGGLVGSTDLELSTGSGLNVKYAPGEIIVPGSTSTTQGGYYCRGSSGGEVSLAAADGTNPRVDRICAVVTDAAYAGTTNTFAISVVTGTPTAGATIAKAEKGEGGVGAAPASSMTLGYALVAAKATTVGEVKTTASRVKLGVAAESILTAMLGTGAVTEPKIASEAVTGPKLGTGTVRQKTGTAQGFLSWGIVSNHGSILAGTGDFSVNTGVSPYEIVWNTPKQNPYTIYAWCPAGGVFANALSMKEGEHPSTEEPVFVGLEKVPIRIFTLRVNGSSVEEITTSATFGFIAVALT